MRNRSRREPPKARIWNWTQTASYLGRSLAAFKDRYPRLLQLGLPAFDDDLGGFDSDAVKAWLDRRSKLETNSAIEAEMLEAARGENTTSVY